MKTKIKVERKNGLGMDEDDNTYVRRFYRAKVVKEIDAGEIGAIVLRFKTDWNSFVRTKKQIAAVVAA